MSTLVALVGLFSLAAAPICLVVCLIQAIRKKPKKKWGVAALVFFVLFVAMMFVPTCEHEWADATCETPKTCTLCEKTEGEPVGHNWLEATCEGPEICSFCGVEQGEALGHDLVEATCAEAKHCSRCDLTEGEPLEHTWIPATCTEAKKCEVCSAIEGDPLGHDFSKMNIVKKASCTETGYAEGVCAACGETTDQEIPMTEHKMGKWTTTVKVTCTEDGEKVQTCTNCDYSVTEVIPMTGHSDGEMKVTTKATYESSGERSVSCKNCDEVLRTEKYELTEKEKEKDYKSKCKSLGYKDICRNPSQYKDKLIKISGKVFQEVSEAESYLEYSVYFVKASGNLYCVMIDNYGSGSRILEDDKITIYGEVGDLLTYETIRGSSNTIPKVYAKYYN